MKAAGIYAIRHRESGRRYIGSSNHVCQRWAEHRSRLGRGVHHSKPLQADWNAFGRDAFEWVLIETIDDREARVVRELELINAEPSPYNTSLDTRTGPRPGYKQSAETRARMSAAQKGLAKSPEHRAALGAARKGTKNRRPDPRLGIPNPAHSARLKGRPLSAEHRAKIAAGLSKHYDTHAVSVEARERIRAKAGRHLKGTKWSDEHRAKIAATKQFNREVRFARQRALLQIDALADVTVPSAPTTNTPVVCVETGATVH